MRFTQRIRRSRQRSSFRVALALAAFVSVQTFFRLASPEFREHEVLLLVPFRQRCCWYCCCCCCCFYCVVLFQHLFSLAVQVVLELVQVKFDGGGGHDYARDNRLTRVLFLFSGRKFSLGFAVEESSSSSSSTPMPFVVPNSNSSTRIDRVEKKSLSLSLRRRSPSLFVLSESNKSQQKPSS